MPDTSITPHITECQSYYGSTGKDTNNLQQNLQEQLHNLHKMTPHL